MTSIDLGMPAAPPPGARSSPAEPADQGRQGPGRRRRPGLRAVDDHDAHRRRQHHAAADRRAHRRPAATSFGSRARARTTPRRCPRSPQHSQIPVIADIHFQPRYVFAAIDAGLRRGTRQPGQHQEVRRPGRRRSPGPPKDHGTSIRIGVNAGSLDPRLLQKYGKATPEALVESAMWEASLFEEHDFHDFKISVKHNDPVVMVRAYELLAEAGDWPLHLGVTEAGPAFQGTIKSVGRLRRPAVQGHRRHHPGLPLRPAGGGGQGRPADPRVAQPPSAPARDRLLPVVRPRPGRRLQARRRGDRRSRRARGPAAGRRHGLRRQRPRRGPRGRPRRRLGQRQGPDLRQGPGHQDRPGVEDRRDPDRGGDADRRGDGGR